MLIIGAVTVGNAMALETVLDDQLINNSPSNSVLTVQSNGGNPILKLVDSSSKTYQIRIDDGTGRMDIYDATLAKNRISIASDGNVGIGITTPLADLSVLDSISHIKVRSNAGASLMEVQAEGGHARVILNDKGDHIFDLRIQDGTDRLDIRDVTNAGAARVSIIDNGNVGLGITTPTEKLDVNGNIRIRGDLISTTDLCIGSCT